jgi:hypothetical protein
MRASILATAAFAISLVGTKCSAQSVRSLPCFKPDSAPMVYGRITKDLEWGYRGYRFSFQVDSGGLRGVVQPTYQGTLQPEVPLDSLTALRGDSLSFSYASANTRDSYRVHVTCAHLRGMARFSQTKTTRGVLTLVIFDRVLPVAKP